MTRDPGTGGWLLKTEPSQYSFADLERERRTVWDGITNPQALRLLHSIREGDRLLIYHTGEERAAVGIARCTRSASPERPGPQSQWIEVEVAQRLPRPVPLQEIKQHPAFANSPLLRQPRLSVVPLTLAQWTAIEAMARGERA